MTCDTSRIKMSLGKWILCWHLDTFQQNPRISEWIWAPFAWNRQWSYRLVQNTSAHCQARRHPRESVLLCYLRYLHQTSTWALWEGLHTHPNSRAHIKSEELTNEQGLKENECILRGELWPKRKQELFISKQGFKIQLVAMEVSLLWGSRPAQLLASWPYNAPFHLSDTLFLYFPL